MLLSRKTILTAFRPGLVNLLVWQRQTLREMSFDDYGKTPKRCSDRRVVSRMRDELSDSIPALLGNYARSLGRSESGLRLADCISHGGTTAAQRPWLASGRINRGLVFRFGV